MTLGTASTSPPPASRLILGCMGLGGTWDQTPLTPANVDQAQAALEAALEIGITLFDHANIYTLGKAEQSFGELFLRQPSLRQKILLQSKCGIRFADAAGPKRYDLSAAHIIDSVENSLRRLNTEHLDILILHRPDPLMIADEVAQAWQQLKAAGKAHRLGVSNMNAAQMANLNAVLPEPLFTNQLEMGLHKTDWLDDGTCFNDAQGQTSLAWSGTLEYCQRHHIQIQAWGALAKGRFSGAAPNEAPNEAPSCVKTTANLVQKLAHQYQTTAEAIVLAWLMRHPAQIRPVIGTTHPNRIRACANADKIRLDREDWYALYQSSRGRELP